MITFHARKCQKLRRIKKHKGFCEICNKILEKYDVVFKIVKLKLPYKCKGF